MYSRSHCNEVYCDYLSSAGHEGQSSGWLFGMNETGLLYNSYTEYVLQGLRYGPVRRSYGVTYGCLRCAQLGRAIELYPGS